MIVEGLVDFFLGLFGTLFGAIEFIRLPLDIITVLGTIIGYGNWVVGIDLLAIFTGSIIFWWVFQLSIGLIVWVWDRLPLT